jgi:hypothetical protein
VFTSGERAVAIEEYLKKEHEQSFVTVVDSLL